MLFLQLRQLAKSKVDVIQNHFGRFRLFVIVFLLFVVMMMFTDDGYKNNGFWGRYNINDDNHMQIDKNEDDDGERRILMEGWRHHDTMVNMKNEEKKGRDMRIWRRDRVIEVI